MDSFNFPSRALYGVSIGVDAPFTTQISLPSSNQGAPSILSSLVGAWSLVSYCAPSIDNPADMAYPLGPDAEGILLYTQDGYMSATLLRPGQTPYASAEPGNASQAELAESTKRYLGYAGPFLLDEAGQRLVVRHKMQLVNFPNWQGNVQTRMMQLRGDELTLGLEGFVDIGGVRRQPMLIWRRMPRNHPVAFEGEE